MRSHKLLVIVLALALALTGAAWAAAAEQEVSVEARVKPILTIDDLQFRDLNDNGVLDPYEDWRLDADARIDDLLSQMTLEEEVGLLFHCMSAGQFAPTYPVTDEFLYEQNCPFPANIQDGRYTEGYSFWYYINEFNITTFLDDQAGMPNELADYHNKVQEIAEGSRLGIPVTFSANREYNAWGSMIDMPHTAFGYANDLDLAAELWSIYGQEMAAIGYHVTLNPYGVELGGWYGEDPNYLAELTALEVTNMQNSGIETCTKHFIARGGPYSFSAARSIGQIYQNWMVPWEAAVDAGTGWIMTNSGTGLTNTVRVEYDNVTMDYLRNELDFDGVVVTDWGPIGRPTRPVSGIAPDGVDLATLSLRELYTRALRNGTDQFGAVSVLPGEDSSVQRDISNFPDAIVNAVLDGTCDEELVDTSARRVLRSKFNQGLFDNPYVDVQAALELCASTDYVANPWEIVDNDTLNAARNPHLVALERQLQAESTVLIKNDGTLLPLADGVKAYVYATSNSDLAADAIGEYATIVDSLDAADVVIARVGTIRVGRSSMPDDAAVGLIADAKAAGKPVVIALDGVDPDVWAIENGDAILRLTFSRPPDHGETWAGFITDVLPSVLADMLFGRSEPGGMLVMEIARSAEQKAEQWNDLSFDTGASDAVRLWLMQMVKDDPYVQLPTNLGDPLFTYGYGMQYNLEPAFAYNTLVVPSTAVPGESFQVSCVLANGGFDGYTTAELVVDGELVESKFMAVGGGEFRVVQFDTALVFDAEGTYTIAVGSLSSDVVVAVPGAE